GIGGHGCSSCSWLPLGRSSIVRYRRLRRMSLGELVCRGRHEASKWLERTGAMTSDRPRRHHGLDVERLRTFGARRFFPGPASEQTRALLALAPAPRDAILR